MQIESGASPAAHAKGSPRPLGPIGSVSRRHQRGVSPCAPMRPSGTLTGGEARVKMCKRYAGTGWGRGVPPGVFSGRPNTVKVPPTGPQYCNRREWVCKQKRRGAPPPTWGKRGLTSRPAGSRQRRRGAMSTDAP
jgi:hypothetical protein